MANIAQQLIFIVKYTTLLINPSITVHYLQSHKYLIHKKKTLNNLKSVTVKAQRTGQLLSLQKLIFNVFNV